MGESELLALQRAARDYALAVDPLCTPDMVKVCGGGKVVVAVAIPKQVQESKKVMVESEEPEAGWVVTATAASYDGKRVKVAPSRLGLLLLLVDAESPIPVKTLSEEGWLPHETCTGEPNVRQHVARLNAEIRAAVAGLDFDPIEGTGQGYRLVFR